MYEQVSSIRCSHQLSPKNSIASASQTVLECQIDATRQQMALNFESVVNDYRFSRQFQALTTDSKFSAIYHYVASMGHLNRMVEEYIKPLISNISQVRKPARETDSIRILQDFRLEFSWNLFGIFSKNIFPFCCKSQ